MALKITQEILDRIIEHGEREYPRESCGLLTGQGDQVAGAHATENLKVDEREDRYLINPENQLKIDEEARKQGLDIIGCYHSHPDWPAEPSKNDLENSWPGYYYIIVSVEKGKAGDARAWQIDDSEEAFEEIKLEKIKK